MKQKKHILDYTVFFQKESEGGYTAIVPTLPGCVSYGETIEEAKLMAKEAIELYLESLSAHQEEIPKESGFLQTKISVRSPSSFAYA